MIAAGGLHVIGTERNESRRIDNQLRGRSGRQGDPGCSRFYLSVEDNLIRIFAPPSMTLWLQRIGMEHDTALESPFLSRAIEGAQRKVEARNFDLRKQLLEYDDVANEQRKVIYRQRNEILYARSFEGLIADIRFQALENLMDLYFPEHAMPEQWEVAGFERELKENFSADLPVQRWLEEDKSLTEQTIFQRVREHLTDVYQHKASLAGPEILTAFERSVLLQSLDFHWREHLVAMDYLRHGIHLRGYAQKNPKQEYKREAFHLFSQMLQRFRVDVLARISTVKVETSEDVEAAEALRRKQQSLDNVTFTHAAAMDLLHQTPTPVPSLEDQKGAAPYVRTDKKVRRNDLCPCGSGKKYKRCHGLVDDTVGSHG